MQDAGLTIFRAVPSRPWPGVANLEVAHVWVRRGAWLGAFMLDDKPTRGITTLLSEPGAVAGQPYWLKANEGKSFIGSYVLGMGFVLEPNEAQRLLDKDPRNKDVLFPYLNGEDLNSRPDQSPSRWVINFFDWPIERAREYPDCFRIVEEKVKPERTRLKPNGEFALRKPLPQKWWIFADKRPELYRTIAGLERVLVTAQTSRMWEPDFQPLGIVFSHTIVVFPLCSWSDFTRLQASFHEFWRLEYGPSLRDDARYTPSDCFETFPFPILTSSELESIGEAYHTHRSQITRSRNEGLTKTYNRFHNPEETSADIQKLRDLHAEMDKAVAAAYGWTDLDLGHGFHETKQGLRYTISEPARREVLQRLLKLNHERYAEEVKQGLHEKKRGAGTGSRGPGKKKAASQPANQQASLFDLDTEDEEASETAGHAAAEHERDAEPSQPQASEPRRPAAKTTTAEAPPSIETLDTVSAGTQKQPPGAN